MNFYELAEFVLDGLKRRMENNNGMIIFATHRSKFEGWLKVELCDLLSDRFSDIIPERDRIDITFDDWAIELKTINTNIRYANVINKHCKITKNTEGVIEDINKLFSSRYLKKSVLFVVFPVTHGNLDWQKQLDRITNHLAELRYCEFNFKEGIPGVIYMGLVN